MARQSKRPTERQHQAVMENLAIAAMSRLQTILQKAGHYDFQQRARELEEQFRAKTHRKEKE